MVHYWLENVFINFLFCSFSIFIFYKFLKKINYHDKNKAKLSDAKNIITSIGLIFSINFFVISLINFFFTDLVNYLPNRFYIFYISIFLFSIIGFIDDRNEIDPKIKLIIQLTLVYFSLTTLDLNSVALPLKLTIFIFLIVWTYIINIINFIDGSDGHCAVHSISFFIGILFISLFLKINFFSTYIAFFIIPSLLIFLFLNKPRAKVYMGDSGSIFLGYLIGFVFLELSINGMFLYVLMLLMYPILDCTITLIIKVSKGHYPWEKLADYFFLIPIKNGQNHSQIFFSSILFNLINLILIILMIHYSNIIFLILSFLLSIILIAYYKTFENE